MVFYICQDDRHQTSSLFLSLLCCVPVGWQSLPTGIQTKFPHCMCAFHLDGIPVHFCCLYLTWYWHFEKNRVSYYLPFHTWSGIEVVITGLTRNQLTGNRPWVRIPPAPPAKPWGLPQGFFDECGRNFRQTFFEKPLAPSGKIWYYIKAVLPFNRQYAGVVQW